MKNCLMILESKYFDFKIMLSHEIYLKIYLGYFLKDVSIWVNLS